MLSKLITCNTKRNGRKAIDLTGHKYNNRTVIKRVGSFHNNNTTTWLVKCDNCGREVVLARRSIVIPELMGHCGSCAQSKRQQQLRSKANANDDK